MTSKTPPRIVADLPSQEHREALHKMIQEMSGMSWQLWVQTLSSFALNVYPVLNLVTETMEELHEARGMEEDGGNQEGAGTPAADSVRPGIPQEGIIHGRSPGGTIPYDYPTEHNPGPTRDPRDTPGCRPIVIRQGIFAEDM